jgi:hypothetical protein
MHLYEDLIAINRSSRLIESATVRKDRVVNSQNKRRGVVARRGDGTFGELIPGETPISDNGYVVARGPISTVEIGVEVKVLAKAMIKQIDRVINDLRRQVVEFRRGGGTPICVAIVGINQADHYVGFEKDNRIPTTGKGGFAHPIQEAAKAEARLTASAQPEYDEFIILRFKATNEEPYPFEWANYNDARLDYAAALSRISARYQKRF